MNRKTIGIIFLKARHGNVKHLNERIKELCSGRNNPDCTVALAVRTAGPYDCVLAVRGGEAESISDFVLSELREERKDVIADSQTFIGWDLSEQKS